MKAGLGVERGLERPREDSREWTQSFVLAGSFGAEEANEKTRD